MYDFGWHKDHGAKTTASAELIINILGKFLEMESVLDVGCGDGRWLAAFQARGASTISGVDGPWTDREQLLISPENVEIKDLLEPFSLGRLYQAAEKPLVESAIDLIFCDQSRHAERGCRMRGRDHQRGHLGGYVDPEAMVPADHPLRQIRPLVNTALARLSPEFDQLYSLTGRPSIPPEQLLRALLLQAFFTLRSERQLMEQLSYNILFRWFVGLSIETPVWDVTVFTKNRDRLLEGDIAHGFLRAILADPQVTRLLSNEHFSVDGTLIEAWASMKSFRPKDGSGEPPGPGRNGARDFHGETRSNDTHASSTDPDARLYKKAEG